MNIISNDDRDLAALAVARDDAGLKAKLAELAAEEERKKQERRQRENAERERAKAAKAQAEAEAAIRAEHQRLFTEKVQSRVPDCQLVIDAIGKVPAVQALYDERFTATYWHRGIDDVLRALLLADLDVEAATTILRQRVQVSEAISKIDPHGTVKDTDVWAIVAIALSRGEPRS